MEPPQFSNYPRQPKGEIDFSSIGRAWQVFMANPGPFIVGVLIIMAIGAVLYLLSMPFTIGMAIAQGSANTFAEALPLMLQRQVISMFIGIGVSVVSAPFVLGLSIMSLKAVRGEKAEISDLMSGWQQAGPAIVVVLLSQLAIQIGMNFCCIPGLLAGGLFLVALPILADKKCGPMEAISQSWSLMSKHLIMASLFFIVTGLVALIGFCACIVGALATLPMYYICQAIVYEDLATLDPAPSV